MTGLRVFLDTHKTTGNILLVAAVVLSFFIVNAGQSFDYVTGPYEDAGAYMMVDVDAVLERDVALDAERVYSVGFDFAATGVEGEMTLVLLEDGEEIARWASDFSEVRDNTWEFFSLPAYLEPDADAVYSIKLVTHTDTGALYTKMQDGELCYALYAVNASLRLKVMIFGSALFLLLAACLIAGARGRVVMGSVLGVLMVLYTAACPPGMTPDESSQFFRAYEVGMVSPFSKPVEKTGGGGNIMPRAVYRYQDADARMDYADTTEVGFSNTALYSPLSYLPQAFGIRLTSLFFDRVQMIYYGGRVAATLCCFVLCLLALRLVPFGRRILFLIMTFPMSLQEMTSLSADGITMALSFFFLACVLHLTYTAKEVRARDKAALGVSGIILSQCKIVYVVMLLLVLLIPDEKFGTRKKSLLFKGALIAAALVLSLAWLAFSSKFLIEFNPGVDSPAQLRYMLTHPLQYVASILRTVLRHGGTWIGWMFGSSMGALSIAITPMVWVTLLVLLVYEIINCNDCTAIPRRRQIWILAATFLLGALLIFSSLYVQWTPLMSDQVNGTQGRYFTPLLGTVTSAVILHRTMVRQRAAKDAAYAPQEGAPAIYLFFIVLLCNSVTLNAIMQHFL